MDRSDSPIFVYSDRNSCCNNLSFFSVIQNDQYNEHVVFSFNKRILKDKEGAEHQYRKIICYTFLFLSFIV
jgi:hypothetical protein